MTVSAKSRYALEIMTDLAERRGKSVSVCAIASRRGISAKYTEQIMAMLKRAGYVRSEKKKSGGYKLVSSPDMYRISDILRLTEGMAFDCGGIRPVNGMWSKVEKAVTEVLDGYTVADLMSEVTE